jgi:formate hydrogenlyase subunit 3/multisubunit Na+/H+ antiporter MnhD subunit
MNDAASQVLPWFPFAPLAAAAYVAFPNRTEDERRVAFLLGTIPALVAGLMLAWQMSTWPGPEPMVIRAWSDFILADGLSVLLVCCTFLLVTAVGLFSFPFMQKEKESGVFTEDGLRLYYAALLVFCGSMTWTAIFNNLVFMFLAVELSAIMGALLISSPRTRRSLEAAFKYNLLVVTAVVFALLGLTLIYAKMSSIDPTMGAVNLSVVGRSATLLPPYLALFVCAVFLVAFGTKAGMMPFHGWLPDAHAEAPAPISALLSGLVITIGAYCLVRTVTLFSPHYSAVVVLLAAIASASMVLGILMAIAQDDLKRMLAYSSISQISYVFEGLGLGTYLGIYSGLFHAVTHMLAKALLFFCVGAILYRLGIRRISELGGLSRKMPLTAMCFFLAALSMGGMPLLGGFMSKYSVVIAVGQSRLWWAMGISAFAGFLTLGCMIWAAYRVFWTEESEKVKALENQPREVPMLMMAPMVGLAALIVFLGVAPKVLFPLLDNATRTILALTSKGGAL